MFFKIYFSRRKFEQDAADLAQKQNGWAAGAYCGEKILSALPDEQYISPMEAKEKIWQDNSYFAIQHIGEVLGDLKTAREELFWLDTWDKNRKACIDNKLIKVRDFLDKLLWKPMKERD